MAKRDPWVVIDLMTGEHVQRFATEREALIWMFARSEGAYEHRFWR